MNDSKMNHVLVETYHYLINNLDTNGFDNNVVIIRFFSKTAGERELSEAVI